MGAQPKYIPWLFDNKEAFEKTLKDNRYSYEMLHSHFMAIYNEHRLGTPVASTPIQAVNVESIVENVVQTSQSPENGGAGQILTQEEIDALISKAS
jgi:hypothetical protein